MYGPKKTNINVHKDFHMGSGKNRERIEKAERAHAEKPAEQAVRKQTLEKERMQEQYDKLRATSSAAVVGSSGKLLRRLPLFMDDSDKPADQAAGADAQAADAKPAAEEKTGAVSKEEQLAIQKALDDERKARDDPLAAIRAHEAAVSAARARAGLGTALPKAQGAAGATSSSDKSGLRRLLPSSLPSANASSRLPSQAATGKPQQPAGQQQPRPVPGAAVPAVGGLRRMKFESE